MATLTFDGNNDCLHCMILTLVQARKSHPGDDVRDVARALADIAAIHVKPENVDEMRATVIADVSKFLDASIQVQRDLGRFKQAAPVGHG